MSDSRENQALVEQAQALLDAGRLNDAADLFRFVLAHDDQDWSSLVGMASIALQSGELPDAIRRYTSLVERDPGFAEGFYKRANAYNRLGQFGAALADYDRAVAVDPAHARAFCNRGTVLERLQRWQEALSSYDLALSLNPSDALAHYNRAAVLRALDRPEEALIACDQAIKLDPHYVAAFVNRGCLLQALSRPAEAEGSFARALELDPRCVTAYVNRGHLLVTLRRPAEAAANYARALELDPLPHELLVSVPVTPLRPTQTFLLGLKRHMQMRTCDWTDIESDIERIAAGLRADLPVILPFQALGLLDDPALQRTAAAVWIGEECRGLAPLERIPVRARGERVRIGYFSPDFRVHPLTELAAGLFENHDRARFEVTAFAFGPETRGGMLTRLQSAFDRWVDLRGKSDRQAALLARDLGIDIAVDLAGFTEHSRFSIFALRAAPLQVSYLGYPGTSGADVMDYLVADLTVVPEEQRSHYAEHLIYLPCFQANDSRRQISDRVFRRDDLGLPSTGFVYCCFNSIYKVLPEMFSCWMRILTRVPGSVLLLFAEGADVRRNLRHAAQARGVDGGRLIFAGWLSPEENRARYRTADLFLDTLPFNAGTTASDALWAGLPLLTCTGAAFAARMAASLLQTLGLPELIASTLGEYEEIAVRLAEQPVRLADLRERLAQNRFTSPLFDTETFTRHLESGFQRAWQRHLDGLSPADIRIDRSP
jgi:predicted O-linked N-acetylglucosamine transferase (SPINDLY family)